MMKTVEVFVNYPPHMRSKRLAYLRLDIETDNTILTPDYVLFGSVKYALSQLLDKQPGAFQIQITMEDEIFHLTWYKNKLIKS